MIQAEEIAFFKKNGYLILRNFFTLSERDTISKTTQALQDAPETPGKWMKYFERAQDNSQLELLNRVENFVPYTPEFQSLIEGSKILTVLQSLSGQEHLLFKEKLNFKLPGGGGFNPHQDAPAFTRFVREQMITLALPVDDSNEENGCLEVATEHRWEGQVLPHPSNGTIERKTLDQIEWKKIPLQFGDALFFSSYLPHHSAHNFSDLPRRCYFLTYNRASLGNLRRDYLNYKRAQFPPRIERNSDDFSNWQGNLARKIY